jgi:hypothetical protein
MKTKTIVVLVVATCGALFIATVASCAGVLFFAYRSMDTAVSPAVDEMFAAIDNDSFVDTYDTHTTAEFKKTVTRAQYERLGQAIKNRLGTLKSKSLHQFNVRQFNADVFADVAYNATFEKGSGTITAKLKKEAGQWRFVGFHVESPAFQQDLATRKCPHCGEPHAANARFCPKCGKQLTEEKKSIPANAEASEPN